MRGTKKELFLGDKLDYPRVTLAIEKLNELNFLAHEILMFVTN